MKAESLHSLESVYCIMVRRMCGASLKHRRGSVDLYSFLGVQNVVDEVRDDRLRGFEHLEH